MRDSLETRDRLTIADSDSPSVVGHFSFGQATEPLTARLHGLIRSYPKGVGIIKEFLQNADDAGARVVRVLMDWRTHASDLLPAPSMRMLSGPALLVYNDATFTDEDIQSIAPPRPVALDWGSMPPTT
jgi:hypothetical protein